MEGRNTNATPSQSHALLVILMQWQHPVCSNTLLIVHTNLQFGNEELCCIFSEFIPTGNYYNFFQKSVWKFCSIDNPNNEK